MSDPPTINILTCIPEDPLTKLADPLLLEEDDPWVKLASSWDARLDALRDMLESTNDR